MTILPAPALTVFSSIQVLVRWCASLGLVVLLPGCAAAPAPAPILPLGQTIERSVPPGGQDEIPLALEGQRYVSLFFESHGPELWVRLSGPEGHLLSETAGVDGRLSWRAESSGAYRISVVAHIPRERASSYRIRLQELRPIGPEDGNRLEAERTLAESKALEVEGKWKEMAEKARQALSLGNAADRFEVLYEIGAAYDGLQEKDQAEQWYQQALQRAVETGDRHGEAKAETAIGMAIFGLPGRTEEGCRHLRKALPVWQDLRDSANLARIFHRLGIQDSLSGRFDEALPRLEEALRLADEVQDLDLPAEIQNVIGNLRGDRGESREALTSYEGALRFATTTRNEGARAVALTGIGRILRRRGEPGKALEKFLEAQQINHRIHNRESEGKVLLHLGAVYVDLGQTENAREKYEEGLRVFRAIDDKRWIANALLRLGSTDLEIGRPEDALNRYKEALEVASKEPRQKGEALYGIGIVQLKLQRLPEAVEALTGALSYQRSDRLGEARTREALGRAYKARGDLEKAADFLYGALKIATEVGASLNESSIRFEIARLARQQGDLRKALQQIQSAIQVLETVRSDIADDPLRTSFFASHRDYYTFYVHLLMELDGREPGQGHDGEALDASERGRSRSLLDLLTAGRMELTRGISTALRQREAEAAARLSEIRTSLIEERSDKHRPAVVEALEARLREAEQERELVEQQIKTDSPDYYQIRHPSLLERDQIQKLIDPDSALLEYSLGEDASYLFVVTRDRGLKAYRLDLSREEIGAEAGKIRKALESPGELTSAFGRAAYRLYRTLVVPAEPSLEGKSRLLIAADGVLNRLPFEVLLTGRQDSSGFSDVYLLNRFTTSYIPSASVLSSLLQQRSSTRSGSAPPPRFMAFAPVYSGAAANVAGNQALRLADQGGAPPALEGAEAEVKAIAERYPGKARLFLGPEASLENVRKQPLISEQVHFAGHGLLDEEHPENSGLLMQDGILRVSDIFNLDLSTGLVVLSACETAGKEVNGEGLVGLTRAFLYAGSPSVVVTLWRVADRKTPELMLRFYSNLDQSGDKAEALRQAKIAMVQRKGLLAHPYYWAPFILVGKAL